MREYLRIVTKEVNCNQDFQKSKNGKVTIINNGYKNNFIISVKNVEKTPDIF